MNTKKSEPFMELASAFQKSRVFLTACELDIFTAIGDGGATSEEVAAKTACDPRATDRLMNALVALELLFKEKDRFFNSSQAAQYLVKGKPQYKSGFGHYNSMWESWSTLTEAVVKGRSVIERRRSKKRLRAFIDRMHNGAVMHAESVVEAVDLTGIRRVLDLGGGSGDYAMTFVKAKEGIEAVVFDQHSVLSLTEEFIEKEGLSDQIALKSGDFLADDIGSGYDLVFISSIVHIYSSEQNAALLKKAHGAINPGGRAIVKDIIMDEDRTSPLGGALFALNMLVATETGDTYTESEVRQWLSAAGFERIERKDIPTGTTLIVGTKP